MMLTDLAIKKLAPPEKRRELPDGKIAGLYLLLQPSGAKSWAVRFRVHGVPRKLTLGSYPAVDLANARRRAQEALGEIAGGKDPAGEKRASRAAARAEREAEGETVRRITEKFLKRYVASKVGAGWGKEIDRMFKVEILPAIGDKRIADVRKAHVLDILDRIHDRGSPITANRCLAIMRKFFNWASDDRDLIAVSPCKGIKAPAEENSRDRVLSGAEIRLVWAASEKVGWPFGPIAQLLLLTGARRGEVAGMRWSELDIGACLWTLPGSRTKNGEPHTIPLSDAALRILGTLPRIEGKSGLVFSTNGATPVSGFSKAKAALEKAILEELRAEADVRGDDPAGATPPPDWTLHDLRRTVATNLQKLGVRLEVTESVLNHVSGSRAGIVGVYQRHEYAAEKRAALDAWARRLEEIVEGRGVAGNVTLLRRTPS